MPCANIPSQGSLLPDEICSEPASYERNATLQSVTYPPVLCGKVRLPASSYLANERAVGLIGWQTVDQRSLLVPQVHFAHFMEPGGF